MEPHILGLAVSVWTAIAAIATALLVATGLWQILAARFQNKKAQTLAACSAYDLNENIYDALKVLWAAREDESLKKEPRKYRPQVLVVLNHLDSIAIGVDQRLYIEALAWDHLNGIVQAIVAQYIDSGCIEKMDISRLSFTHLLDMRDRWARAKPRFRDGITWRFWSRQ
jgi:hypothetical protein